MIVCSTLAGCGDDDDAEESPSASATAEASAVSTVEGATNEPTQAPDQQSQWQDLPPLAGGPRQETAVVELEGLVYVLGGFNGLGQIVPAVEAYDPASDEWTLRADLPVAMHHTNAAAVGDKLYVTGFLTGNFVADGRVFVYDPGTDSWSEGRSMPAGSERGASATAVLDGIIYVAGGLRNGAVPDFSSYDPATDGWEGRAELPTQLDHLVAGAIDDRIYVAGGRNARIESHTNALHIYDPASDSWSLGAPMPTSRGGAAAAVANGRLFVCGGEGNTGHPSGVFDNVEAYDPETDTWEVLEPMATPRHGTGAAAIDGDIVVPGGATVQAFGAVATNEVLAVP